MGNDLLKRKTKLDKLNEKYLNEKCEYKKIQLLSKIKRLETKTFWDSDFKKTYIKKGGGKNV